MGWDDAPEIDFMMGGDNMMGGVMGNITSNGSIPGL